MRGWATYTGRKRSSPSPWLKARLKRVTASASRWAGVLRQTGLIQLRSVQSAVSLQSSSSLIDLSISSKSVFSFFMVLSGPTILM
jgi:hypothetical protein